MPSPTNDLWKKSATEVVSLLKKKELSPNEVLNENLKRITYGKRYDLPLDKIKEMLLI